MTTVLTYGTFDLFHIGHLRLLERAAALGDKLLVGISTDEFDQLKGKRCVQPYEERASIVAALRVVDGVFPETSWAQKTEDVRRLGVDVFVMGADWAGKFDFLEEHCRVVYLDRTAGVSTRERKEAIQSGDWSTRARPQK